MSIGKTKKAGFFVFFSPSERENSDDSAYSRGLLFQEAPKGSGKARGLLFAVVGFIGIRRGIVLEILVVPILFLQSLGGVVALKRRCVIVAEYRHLRTVSKRVRRRLGFGRLFFRSGLCGLRISVSAAVVVAVVFLCRPVRMTLLRNRGGAENQHNKHDLQNQSHYAEQQRHKRRFFGQESRGQRKYGKRSKAVHRLAVAHILHTIRILRMPTKQNEQRDRLKQDHSSERHEQPCQINPNRDFCNLRAERFNRSVYAASGGGVADVRNRGSAEQLKEARGQVYFPLKGFVAGAVAMLIPFILTVVYCIVSYKAYETGMAETSDLIYNILYLLFLAYTPMLVTATPVTTTAFFFYGMPQRGDFAIYGIGNMVMPYMFFIPIVLFILVCGVCYIMGYTKRRGEVPAHMREVYFPRNCKYVPMDHTGEDEEAPDTGAPSASAEGAEESPEEGAEDGVKAPADDAAGEDGAADGTQEPETAEHRQ